MPELKLKRGNAARVEGLVSLRVKEGEVSVSGGARKAGERITIPRARSLPLEAETNAIVEYKLGAGGKIKTPSGRAIPPEWYGLAEGILHERPRIILVEGDVDTGKTLFSTYLANFLHQHGVRVAVVDGDPGQSDIGPPGTVGLGILEKSASLLQEVPVKSTYFVGSTSPSAHMVELLIGMKRAVKRGLGMADTVIVDTVGWIFGPGRVLKSYEEELIKPDLVVALQRGTELEHLLKVFESTEIKRLKVPAGVRKRTQADRLLLRELSFAKYLENSTKLILDLDRVKLERCRTYAELPDPRMVRELESRFGAPGEIKGGKRNLLIALVGSQGEMIGIGVVDRIDFARHRMVVFTPLKEAGQVKIVQLGSMRVTPDGKEVGAVKAENS